MGDYSNTSSYRQLPKLGQQLNQNHQRDKSERSLHQASLQANQSSIRNPFALNEQEPTEQLGGYPIKTKPGLRSTSNESHNNQESSRPAGMTVKEIELLRD